ncbi:MAG: hypothetical protein KF708_07900 [Pirellulales bacterium]|nr:hypothetical protein [Pirellulales bacterium]
MEIEQRIVATTVEGFVQQLVSYITRGYRYYVTGEVPLGKDAATIDEKLIARYGIDAKKWTRARRKSQGLANLRYLRHGRFFVILATPGNSEFFREERNVIRDIREIPIKFAGYSVSLRPGGRRRDGSADPKLRAHVRIETARYRELKSYFVGIATHRRAETLAAELWRVPFEPYAPVRRQLLNILRAVNQTRKLAGFERLPYSVLRYKRRIVRPFGEPPPTKSLAA